MHEDDHRTFTDAARRRRRPASRVTLLAIAAVLWTSGTIYRLAFSLVS